MVTYKFFNASNNAMESFTDYGVWVSASKGLTDLPKRKTPLTVDWNDSNGQYIDLSRPTYQAREITLECFICANGYVDFVTKCNSFVTLLSGAGLQYLQVVLDGTNNANGILHNFVYLKDGVAFNKTWNEYKMVGTFTLKLVEPEMLYKVEYSTLTGSNTSRTITFTASHLCKYVVINSHPTNGWSFSWTYNVIGNTTITVASSNPQWVAIFANKQDITNYTNTQSQSAS